MTTRAVLYARVSQPATQDAEDKVSIDQQLANQRALCERNGWQVIGEFVDSENYKATQSPKRGKTVNPSGERADRPRFVAMLEVVKTGEADAVLCWRDDRLVRHPRVAVALEDALDIGDARRNGRPKIEIRDATGATIDRFTLSIKATIWREENKRRAERTRMGKVATLERGFWPGGYTRYGYKTRKAERGRVIEIEETEAAWVRKIHEMYDAGVSVREIRRRLINAGAPQRGSSRRRHSWSCSVINQILRAEAYAGVATYRFTDGTQKMISIPEIVDHDTWKRNQERIERNKTLSTRNAAGVYLLQNILFCGECGMRMCASRKRWSYVGGVKRENPRQQHNYYCIRTIHYSDEPHPPKYIRYGPTLDWLVWRHVVDRVIKHPDLICEQVLNRQVELQTQGDSLDGEIEHARRRSTEVDDERTFYQRQAARGKMTEVEFDARMEETEEARRYWQSEIERLRELRDDAEKVRDGLDYATELLTKIQASLPKVDVPPKMWRKLPKEERQEILRQRREIILALVDRVTVYSDDRVEIEGLIDGGEAARFELVRLWADLPKMQYFLTSLLGNAPNSTLQCPPVQGGASPSSDVAQVGPAAV